MCQLCCTLRECLTRDVLVRRRGLLDLGKAGTGVVTFLNARPMYRSNTFYRLPVGPVQHFCLPVYMAESACLMLILACAPPYPFMYCRCTEAKLLQPTELNRRAWNGTLEIQQPHHLKMVFKALSHHGRETIHIKHKRFLHSACLTRQLGLICFF